MKSWRALHAGWMLIPFFSLLHPFHISRCCSNHSLPNSSFLLPLNLASWSGKHCKLPTVPSKIMTANRKVRRDQIHLIPMISNVGRYASCGSHRAAAPKSISCAVVSGHINATSRHFGLPPHTCHKAVTGICPST